MDPRVSTSSAWWEGKRYTRVWQGYPESAIAGNVPAEFFDIYRQGGRPATGLTTPGRSYVILTKPEEPKLAWLDGYRWRSGGAGRSAGTLRYSREIRVL